MVAISQKSILYTCETCEHIEILYYTSERVLRLNCHYIDFTNVEWPDVHGAALVVLPALFLVPGAADSIKKRCWIHFNILLDWYSDVSNHTRWQWLCSWGGSYQVLASRTWNCNKVFICKIQSMKRWVQWLCPFSLSLFSHSLSIHEEIWTQNILKNGKHVCSRCTHTSTYIDSHKLKKKKRQVCIIST